MSELPTQFMSAESASSESAAEQVFDPELVQARMMVQTIERFQALNRKVGKISDHIERRIVQRKLDALAEREYGRVWDVLKRPWAEVIPLVHGGRTGSELLTALAANDIDVSSLAEDLLHQPAFETSRTKIPTPTILVQLTVGRLGFRDRAKTADIFATAKSLGLALCPPNVGPELRLQDSDTDFKLIAMEPITDRYNSASIFCLYNQGSRKKRLLASVEYSQWWDLNDQVVFLVRPPTLQGAQDEVSNA